MRFRLRRDVGLRDTEDLRRNPKDSTAHPVYELTIHPKIAAGIL